VTDLPLRQIHYYGENTLLVYNSGEYATWWHNKLSDNVEKTIKEMVEMVFEVHGQDPKTASKLVRYRYKYWPIGSHKWAKGVDFKKQLEIIQYGGENNTLVANDDSIHNNVFIAGDSYSFEQGWVEGAITSAENVLINCFYLKPWKDVTNEEIWTVFPKKDLATIVEGQTSNEQYYQLNEKPKFRLIQTTPTKMKSGDGAEQDAEAYKKSANWWTFTAKFGYIEFENKEATPIKYFGHITWNADACVDNFVIENSDDGEKWARASDILTYKFPGRWGVYRINIGPAKHLRFRVLNNKKEWWTGINHVEFYADNE